MGEDKRSTQRRESLLARVIVAATIVGTVFIARSWDSTRVAVFQPSGPARKASVQHLM